MAEALARKIAQRRGIKDLNVSSAGTNAWDNATATDEALLVGMEREVDLTSHRSRKLTPAIVSEADLIFVMELRQIIGTRSDETPILYGGSVNAGNAASLLSSPEVDGLLVGGASVDAQSWLSIAQT